MSRLWGDVNDQSLIPGRNEIFKKKAKCSPITIFLKQSLFPFWFNALIESTNAGETISFIRATEL